MSNEVKKQIAKTAYPALKADQIKTAFDGQILYIDDFQIAPFQFVSNSMHRNKSHRSRIKQIGFDAFGIPQADLYF